MTGLEALNKIDEVLCDIEIKYKENLGYTKPLTKTIEKSLKALEIIKRFIWVEDGKLMCGRYGDVEIELDESDFEDEEEFNLLKEVLE